MCRSRSSKYAQENPFVHRKHKHNMKPAIGSIVIASTGTIERGNGEDSHRVESAAGRGSLLSLGSPELHHTTDTLAPARLFLLLKTFRGARATLDRKLTLLAM